MKIIPLAELRESERTSVFVGREHGARISFFVTSHRRGEGPDPHRHPYEETFIVEEGTATFVVEGRTVLARAGQVVVVPAGAAHSFVNSGHGVLRQVSIHPSDRMIQEWIEG